MNYGRGLMLARTKVGLSKRALSVQAGLDPSYVAHLEAGRKKPSLEALDKIAEVLKLPVPLLMLMSAEDQDLRGIQDEDVRILSERLASICQTPES